MHRGPVTDLATRLRRIDALLVRADPNLLATLSPGAPQAALDALAKRLGAPLPEALATFFRWHDGQSRPCTIHPCATRMPMSIEQATNAWAFLSAPGSDIARPWSPSWFPIFENGAGDHLCFELAGPSAGCLVEYWHADNDRPIAFPSLSAWAEDLTRRLEHDVSARAAAPNPRIELDTSATVWTKLTRAPSEAELAERPVGTAIWVSEVLPMRGHPDVNLYVKCESGTRTPWRSSWASQISEALERLQAKFAQVRPPEGHEWKASDFSVADKLAHVKSGAELFEGVIALRVM